MNEEQLSHFPVMVNEVVTFLEPQSEKIYLDCTFGQGGYSKKILDSANCNVLAIDRDLKSKEYAKDLIQKYKKRFIFCNGKFSDLYSLIKEKKINSFDGIVLDLGISNTQLNDPKRGFSFMHDGPLDMRMDTQNKLTAEIIINEFDEKELSDIFFYYGEERNSKRIARSIAIFRKKRRINSTKVLSEIIQKVNNNKFKHPATRVFQALRIYINEELNELEGVLNTCMKILNKKSRIIIVAFHSLEDRIVKNFFREKSLKKINNDKKVFENESLKVITKKPLTPSFKEIRSNPRSRSAKLRVAEKA